MSRPFLLLALVSSALLLTGCINPLPKVKADRSDSSAWRLLQASAEAHGGEDTFADINDIAVSYDGQWLNKIWNLQPVLVDKGFRKSSEERIVYREPAWPYVAQVHTGEDGTKTVTWDGAFAEVRYEGGEPPSDDAELSAEAAAMVAEAYRMFLTGPFYFTQRRGVATAVMGKRDEVTGRLCDQVLVGLRPGFGESEEDRVLVAIDRDSKLVRRVRFSLDGFRKTGGATADVELTDHIEVGGIQWPTQYLEIVRFPINREVHRWELVGIDVNRGLSLDELSVDTWSDEAMRAAEPLTE